MPSPHPVPREPTPLPHEKDLLKDRPGPGYWVMGLRQPIYVWWRCPLCLGQVPLDPGRDLGSDGVVKEEDVVHSYGNNTGEPKCSWILPLRLLDYEAPR